MIEFARGDSTAFTCGFVSVEDDPEFPLFRLDDEWRERMGEKDAPCVLKSSLQCGDHCRE